MIELSIIAPVLNEVEAINPFLDRLNEVLPAATESFEVIFVDDGSSDGTTQKILDRRATDDRVKLLRLSRNYGKEVALTAGLDCAAGAAAVPMDVDLQDPPELIPEMMAKWRAGADIVLARRISRNDDTYFKRFTAAGFYRLLKFIGVTPIPENVGDFRLLDRKALDGLAQFPERTRFMKGMFALLGFEQAEVTYERPARTVSAPGQRIRSLLSLALEGVISFSVAPLRIWSVIGLFTAIMSALYGMFIILNALIFGIDVPGYASLITVVLFMNGLILLGLGIIGEYLSRVFTEVKQRPLYLVRDVQGVELRRDVSAAKRPELEK